jgi:hypothetical protein
VIVLGVFDKGLMKRFFLAYSKDNGETCANVSSQTQILVGESSNTTEIDTVELISEDSRGRVLIGITRSQTKTLPSCN